MGKVTVAAIQMGCRRQADLNIDKAEAMVREAAHQGGQIILLPELFTTRYFCQKEKAENFIYAKELEKDPAVQNCCALARELQVVLPVSFYEKKNQARYNTVAVIDADGEILGVYRKSHIPDGPGYEEKFYFNPGDTGFRVWDTRYGKIGIGICWDQWYPEAARCMALLGAEMLLYPTAIGSEPEDLAIDSCPHWQIVMQGHAAANLMPVIAANRIGVEKEDESQITFYGSSFIAGPQGNIIAQAGRGEEKIILAEFDLRLLERQRLEWGVFRDRRPDLYKLLCSYDGETILK